METKRHATGPAGRSIIIAYDNDEHASGPRYLTVVINGINRGKIERGSTEKYLIETDECTLMVQQDWSISRPPVLSFLSRANHQTYITCEYIPQPLRIVIHLPIYMMLTFLADRLKLSAHSVWANYGTSFITSMLVLGISAVLAQSIVYKWKTPITLSKVSVSPSGLRIIKRVRVKPLRPFAMTEWP